MISTVTIVSIGSGDPELLNLKSIKILQAAEKVILRTEKTALSDWCRQEQIAYSTMDSLYEETEDFDALYPAIARDIWQKAADSPIVYAVPDPSTDQSVKELYRQKPEGGAIEMIPGISSFDIRMAALAPWCTQNDLRVTSAYELLESEYNPNCTLMISEMDNPILAGEIKIFLSNYLEDTHEVIICHGDHAPEAIALYELDRLTSYDHRTTALIPASDFLHRERYSLQDLREIMERLRAPDGCPWDRKQTHESLEPFLIEEAWECVASIRNNDMPHLSDELGDLLFQIIFHASIGKSFDEFTMDDVICNICEKMIRRHPHVFGTENRERTAYSNESWEKIKQAENGGHTLIESLEDVTPFLPSLKYAGKVMKKLKRIEAFKRSPAEITAEIEKILDEIKASSASVEKESIGKLLLACSELCYALDKDGEVLLHESVETLKTQLRSAEKAAKKDGKAIESLTFPELGVYLKHVEDEIS